jgi:fucose 4-O-acetylase-like acetyltransferase
MRRFRLREPEGSRIGYMSPRRFEVDLVKAVGIVAVVLIHSVRPFFDPGVSAAELWLLSALQFAVPGFFAASGVLYASAERVGANLTRARLRRLLIPYLLASVAAQAFWVLFEGRALAPKRVLLDFVLGSSFGPFYYVFHAVLLVLAAPLLARLPARTLAAVTAAALLAQAASWIVPEYRFYAVQNSLHWLAFFLAGWQLGRNDEAVARGLSQRRGAAVLAAGGAALLLSLHQPLGSGLRLAGALQWLVVACTLAVFLALGAGRETRSRLVRFLSDSTYTIYLFHLFFVYPLQRLLAPAPGAFEPLAIAPVWLAGLAGPLAIAAAGRALLGARSRTLLGS